MLGLRVSLMSRSLLSQQILMINQKPALTPWDQILLVFPCLGKGFWRKQKMAWRVIVP